MSSNKTTKMHYSTFLTTALIATTNIARADWLDDEDVPSQCSDVCRPVVQASDRCEDQFDDDDDQRNCICTTANFNTIIPNCELCIRNSSDDEDEIRDLRQDCGLPSPTGTASGTGRAHSTPSVTTSTSMATVTQGGSTTTSQSVVTVTSTTGGGGSQASPTSESSNKNQNGAETNIAYLAAAGAMAIAAVLAAMF